MMLPCVRCCAHASLCVRYNHSSAPVPLSFLSCMRSLATRRATLVCRHGRAGPHARPAVLRDYCTLRPLTLPLAASPPSSSAAPPAHCLLIDASAVLYMLAGRLDASLLGVESTDEHGAMFATTLAYVTALRCTGLRLVFVVDSAYEACHAGSYCSRRAARVADGAALSPGVESAFLAALDAAAATACGAVEVHYAAREADVTLLAYYVRHKAAVQALLTGESATSLCMGCVDVNSDCERRCRTAELRLFRSGGTRGAAFGRAADGRLADAVHLSLRRRMDGASSRRTPRWHAAAGRAGAAVAARAGGSAPGH